MIHMSSSKPDFDEQFLTLQSVMNEVLKNDGDDSYNIQHMRDIAKCLQG